MPWARLKVVASKAGAQVLGERVFNLSQAQWWIGHGDIVELQYAGHDPVFVAIRDKRMEMLTGTSGGYSSE